MKLLATILLALMLAACASTPGFDTSGVDPDLTPRRAAAQQVEGEQVVWGGVIVNSTNLEDVTRLEILAYPLARNQRPQTDQRALGRFIGLRSGYIETADYAPGRQITVTGVLEGAAEGQVGQSRYTYPVVELEQLYLWPEERVRREPRVNFGVGIMIGN